MKHIKITQGDITRAKVDAIVNAANPTMLGGGGVDGAIHRAAGPTLLEECKNVDAESGIRCPFGQARITLSGNLPSKYVIHTAGPIYRNEDDPKRVLISSYENSLRLALDNDCRSIAFPAISCGAYGYPHHEATSIAIETCGKLEFRQLDIHFYLYGESMYQLWLSIYEQALN